MPEVQRGDLSDTSQQPLQAGRLEMSTGWKWKRRLQVSIFYGMLTVIRQNGKVIVVVFVRRGLPEALESRRQRYCSGTLELSPDPKLPFPPLPLQVAGELTFLDIPLHRSSNC